MRVVSICPSNTEILAYLGLTHLLVGIDDFSDWPESVLNLPRLGPDLSIDMDKVEELKPDLVLASLSVPGMEKNIEALEQRGLPYIILNPQNLTDIENDLFETGKALNEPQLATKAAHLFRKNIHTIKQAGAKANSLPTLYWEWWPKPVFTPGKVNWLTEVSRMVGAVNSFEDVDLASVQTDWDDVFKRNPDYICLAWVGVRKQKVKPDIVIKRPGWDQLEAVRKNKILVLEEELFCRPSPRLLDGALRLGKLIHPELFSNLELEKLD